MPAVREGRFARAEILREMKPASVRALLGPFRDYFAARGVPLVDDPDPEYFTWIALVLATPRQSTPPDLVERLELLDMICDLQSALNFERDYHDAVARLREPDDSAADLAVKMLVQAPWLAWREFDRRALARERSLVSYRARPTHPFLGVSQEGIAAVEGRLAPWFEANGRGGVCRVHSLEEPDGVAFVVRHGDLLTRVGVVAEDGRSASQILRPERLDVAHYRVSTREWQISGIGTRLQDAYRAAFGDVFHGSDQALAASLRYSLEPLRDGPSSMKPEGAVVQATLKRVRLDSPKGQRITLERGDIIKALHDLDVDLLHTAKLIDATIHLQLAGRRSRVKVNICPARGTIVGTSEIPAVDRWLAARRFANDDEGAAVLESA